MSKCAILTQTRIAIIGTGQGTAPPPPRPHRAPPAAPRPRFSACKCNTGWPGWPSPAAAETGVLRFPPLRPPIGTARPLLVIHPTTRAPRYAVAG